MGLLLFSSYSLILNLLVAVFVVLISVLVEQRRQLLDDRALQGLHGREAAQTGQSIALPKVLD